MPATADTDADRCRCMIYGCICCYHAWDCNNPIFLFKGADDCLCLRHSCCIAINTPTKGCGLTTNKERGEFCKIGCFCCDWALLMPTKLCGCADQCLCCYNVANCPCSNEFIPSPVCTILLPGLQICPRCGCCVAPPPCPALDKVLRDEPLPLIAEEMNRDENVQKAPSSNTGDDNVQKAPNNNTDPPEMKTTPDPPGTKTITESVNSDGNKVIVEKVVNTDGSLSVTEKIVANS